MAIKNSLLLFERTMTLTMNGITSSSKKLNGSCPQGVFLGVFFFIIAFNSAFLRPPIERPMKKESHDKNAEDQKVKEIPEKQNKRSQL